MDELLQNFLNKEIRLYKLYMNFIF